MPASLVPAHLLGVVVRRVVAARHPVEDEVELLLREGRRRGEARSGQAGGESEAVEERACRLLKGSLCAQVATSLANGLS